MADAWQLEENTDRWLLEDASGVWLLENGIYVRDTFDRGNQANWGTPDEGPIWGTHASSSILTNKGRFTSGAGGSPIVRTPTKYTDIDVVVTFQVSNTTSWDLDIRLRDDTVNYVRGIVDVSGPVALYIQQQVGGVGTDLATVATSVSAATDYRLRFQAEGSTLRLKFWLASATEPAAWDLTASTSWLSEGFAGLADFSTTAVNIDWNDYQAGVIGINDAAGSPVMPYAGAGYYPN